MKTSLFALGALAASAASLSAQTFFASTPNYLAPAWRGTANAQHQNWDYFYSANYTYTLGGITYHDGVNYPDMGVQVGGVNLVDNAPYGVGAASGSAPNGFPIPQNAGSGAWAFWDTRNATLAQTGTTSAFMAGAIQGTGNIYSFSEPPTGYELKNTTPFTLGTVVLQWQTAGTFMDLNSVRLVAPNGTEYAPTNLIQEFRQGGGAMGGIDNRVGIQWNLTGLNLTSYTVKFVSSGSSTSFQELLLDTNNTYTEVVPSTRAWSAGTGNWSTASNWGTSAIPTAAGNVTFASGTGAVIDATSRTVSELRLTAPGSFNLSATGGASLKINTGITATPAAAANYTITAPVVINSLNMTTVGTGSVVTLSGGLTGTAGIYKQGAGTLRFTGSVNLPAAITVAGGTLDVGSTGTLGDIALSAGTRLAVNGTLSSGGLTVDHATVSGSGTLNRALTFDEGDVLSPGNSIGKLTTIGQTWSPSGTLKLELGDATSTSGVGWDAVAVNGTLNLLAANGTFTLALQTLDINGTAGLMQNFNAAGAFSWLFATSTTLTNFSASDFTIDTSGFANGLNGGSFNVSATGNNLYLNFVPVPEPNSASLCILGVAFVAVWRNRRFISGQDRPE